jgi:hypothetical protein
VFRECLN